MKLISIRNAFVFILINLFLVVPSVFAREDNLVFPEQISDLKRIKVTKGNNPYSKGNVGVSYEKSGTIKLLISYTPKKNFPETSAEALLKVRAALFQKQLPSAETITPPWDMFGCNEPTVQGSVQWFKISQANSTYGEVLYSTEIDEYLVYIRVTYMRHPENVRYMAEQLHSALNELKLPFICSQVDSKENKN